MRVSVLTIGNFIHIKLGDCWYAFKTKNFVLAIFMALIKHKIGGEK